ncbi:unnamed protein product [Heligmosomoides polygyrus]|uniref:Transposase n=1 Tax=Heligmosomoides polygyrus TaxID=6339 RepID=A0A183FN59_HELPZ|nr:unnamed protein product [Heligmosomoides polygyrus]
MTREKRLDERRGHHGESDGRPASTILRFTALNLCEQQQQKPVHMDVVDIYAHIGGLVQPVKKPTSEQAEQLQWSSYQE